MMSFPAPAQITSSPGVPLIRSAKAVPEMLQAGRDRAKLVAGKLVMNSGTRAAIASVLRLIRNLLFGSFIEI
jgi:hypothetical protein